MTCLVKLVLATLALMFIATSSASPIRCGHGMRRYGDSGNSRSLRYCRDEYDDEDDYGYGSRYYDYDGEEEDWDSNEDEDYLDGGNYDNEDTDMGEDDWGYHRGGRHEA